MAKLKWMLPDGWVRGPHFEWRAGDYLIHNEYRITGRFRYGEFFVVSHKGEPFAEAPMLLEAKRIAQQHAREQED